MPGRASRRTWRNSVAVPEPTVRAIPGASVVVRSDLVQIAEVGQLLPPVFAGSGRRGPTRDWLGRGVGVSLMIIPPHQERAAGVGRPPPGEPTELIYATRASATCGWWRREGSTRIIVSNAAGGAMKIRRGITGDFLLQTVAAGHARRERVSAFAARDLETIRRSALTLRGRFTKRGSLLGIGGRAAGPLPAVGESSSAGRCFFRRRGDASDENPVHDLGYRTGAAQRRRVRTGRGDRPGASRQDAAASPGPERTTATGSGPTRPG